MTQARGEVFYLKLMYLAEREAILRSNSSITGEHGLGSVGRLYRRYENLFEPVIDIPSGGTTAIAGNE